MSVQPGTPLPWAAEYLPGSLLFKIAGASVVGYTRPSAIPERLPKIEQDAAYIVTACNSFPELVAALENDVARLRRIAEKLCDGHLASPTNRMAFANYVRNCIAETEAALSKVQVG